MVGVGGRSKACDNCRRRRVKCDLTVPICQRCIKARLQCGGPRDLTIIPYNGENKSKSPSSSASLSDSATLPNEEQRIVKVHQPDIKLGLNLSIPYDDIFIAYTHTNLLHGNEEIIVPEIVERAIAGQCFLALATTYFGIEHHEKAITQRGFRRYGNALSVLHSALGKSDASQSFDVLEAIMIMELIEFLISDREDGWINHARGLEKLYDMRGPESMAPLPYLMILERTRPSIIFTGIVTHQPTIMARPEWKEKPWLMHPERIDSLKLLYDILADCPELFALRDQVIACAEEDDKTALIQSLLGKAHSILRDIGQWENEWAKTPSHQSTEVPLPPDTDSPSYLHQLPWQTILHYKTFYRANAMVVYNGALILILRFIQSLHFLRNDTIENETLQTRLYTAAITICRSVDYHLDKVWGGQSSFALFFPLRMAYDAVGKADPAVEKWLRRVVDEIAAASKGRWKAAKYILDMGARNGGGDSVSLRGSLYRF